jgi:hypothetical protein
MNRFVEPQEVASVMLFLCSADASAMTGQAINMPGRFITTKLAIVRRTRRIRSTKEEDKEDRTCTS